MAIQQQVFRLAGNGLDDGQWFDQTNFMDGLDNLLVFSRAHDAVWHLFFVQ
jgi:hypothetical protein